MRYSCRCFAEVTNFWNFPILYCITSGSVFRRCTTRLYSRFHVHHNICFSPKIYKTFSFPTTSTRGDPMVNPHSNNNNNNHTHATTTSSNPNNHGHITRESIRNSVLAGYVAGKSVSNHHYISYMKHETVLILISILLFIRVS